MIFSCYILRLFDAQVPNICQLSRKQWQNMIFFIYYFVGFVEI